MANANRFRYFFLAPLVFLLLFSKTTAGVPPQQIVPQPAQEQPPNPLPWPQALVLPQLPPPAIPPPRLIEGSYLFTWRTPGHVKFSDPEAFHNAAQAVRELLAEHQIVIFPDPVRGKIVTSEVFSTESKLALARRSGAAYLLEVSIDRPITKWLKIKIECYDMTGKLLWQEEASHGGGLNSAESLKKVTGELHQRLEQHLGGPGLLTTMPEKTAVPGANPGH
jgi:hypothetical protein